MTIVLSHSGSALTLNKAISSHWSAREPVVKEWRESFFWLGKTIRYISDRVGIEAHFERCSGTKRQHLGDAMAHALLAKAAVDGLVDAKALRDDDGRYVAWVRCHAPVLGADVPKNLIRLRLEIIELDQ